MRVIALNKFEYANKLRLAGDEFDTTSESDADILILAQQVKKAPQLATRAIKAEEEQPPMTTENSKPITPLPKKNKYMRRDMRAEE